MNRETIEKAAQSYCDNKPYVETVLNKNAFIDGAQWRINSAWHDASEETPMAFSPVLTVHHSGRYSVNMLGKEETCPRAWDKWAYIDDLLPNNGREE